MTSECEYVQLNRMRSRQLHDALENLINAIREVEAVVETMCTVARPAGITHLHFTPQLSERSRHKRWKTPRDNARLSYNTACELGFRGNLDEWERLMGAVTKR